MTSNKDQNRDHALNAQPANILRHKILYRRLHLECKSTKFPYELILSAFRRRKRQHGVVDIN